MTDFMRSPQASATASNTGSRVAVVTGGAGGIGLGLARACANDAMSVVIADLDVARAESAASDLRAEGATAQAWACDVRDAAELDRLRDHVLGIFDRVDLVCLNAGLGLVKPVAECNETDWATLFEVNVNGVINGIRSFLPTMIAQGYGHLSATASLSGLVADPDLAVYNGTKFAVVGIMESLAHELRRDHRRIGASVLCPGPVATDIVANSSKSLADAGSATQGNDDISEYLARGLSPETVGRGAIDGINNGDFWLFPHPELTLGLIDGRTAAMRDRRLFVPDVEWTDQS